MFVAPLTRLPVGVLIALILLGCGASQPDNYSLKTADFDPSPLWEMPSYGDFDPQQDLQHDLSVLLYFSELSCSTCTDRELRRMVDWHHRWGDRVDFVLAVQGQDPIYLRNLRRLGKVTWPILLAEENTLPLPETAVVVFSKQENKALAQWRPLPDSPNADRIAGLIEQLIEQTLNPST